MSYRLKTTTIGTATRNKVKRHSKHPDPVLNVRVILVVGKKQAARSTRIDYSGGGYSLPSLLRSDGIVDCFLSLLRSQGSITWLCFYKDTHLLSASEDRSICVWRCGSWDCLRVLSGHRSVSLSSGMTTQRHFKRTTICCLTSRAPVTCVSVHPSGKLALSVAKDRTLR